MTDRLPSHDWPDLLPGWVWLCGAGPGDPGLLTLHALNALRQADVIVYDALVSEAILDWGPQAERIYAGKRGGKPSHVQRDISLRLVDLARAGRRVLRLKGGDPFVFGRGGEEAQTLVQHGVPIRIVPGITAGIAGLAYAGIPVTHRDVNQSVTFVTGHDRDGNAPTALDWAGIARGSQVIVIYMGMKHIGEIAARLIAAGRTPIRARRRHHHRDDGRAAHDRDHARPRRGRHRRRRGWSRRRSSASAWPSPCVRRSTGRRRPPVTRRATSTPSTCAAPPKRADMPGLILAAPSSGSGKTTITLGLLRALRDRGLVVRGAKSGPDYIDPRFHAAASGAECTNLDAWAMSPAMIAGLAATPDLLLIEGAMGLFDGAPPDGRGAVADLARLLRLPVVLVVDAARMAQSIAPLVAGFAAHDPDVQVAAVILNRVGSPRHEAMLRAACPLPVLGCIPRDPVLVTPSRHLGLVQAVEHPALEPFLSHAARIMADRIDIDALVRLAAPLPDAPRLHIAPPAQRIALARDAAFAFAYPHLLDAWHDAGAEILPFSPLADAPAPAADLVLLPGGYPELHAGRLAGNARFLASLRNRPVHGECGGYMVMGDGLVDADGTRHAMAGLLRLETTFADRRLHLGYRTLAARAGPFPGRWAAHEFHYATTLRADGPPLFDAADAEGTALAPMGLREGPATGSFAHLIAPLQPPTVPIRSPAGGPGGPGVGSTP